MLYAFEKFHLAAEMLRSVQDRHVLAEAYAGELSHINDVDIPDQFASEIKDCLGKFDLPSNVQTINRIGHARAALEVLSDKEIDDLVKHIFSLEERLRMLI